MTNMIANAAISFEVSAGPRRAAVIEAAIAVMRGAVVEMTGLRGKYFGRVSVTLFCALAK